MRTVAAITLLAILLSACSHGRNTQRAAYIQDSHHGELAH